MATTKATTKEVVTYKLGSQLGEMMALAKELAVSRIVPAAYAANPAGIFAAIQYGKEMGIKPMTALQNIAVINGKPTLGTDMFLGLCHRHPEWGGYEILESTDLKCTIAVYRVNAKSKKTATFKSTFTMEDAKKAGLYRAGGPWEKWAKRMLKHRATAFALRDAFSDVLSGIYTEEEMDPDRGAMTELAEVSSGDAIEAEIIEDKPLPVQPNKIAPKKAAKK